MTRYTPDGNGVLLTTGDIERKYGIGRKRVHALKKKGVLKPFRNGWGPGSADLYLEDDVVAYVKSLPEGDGRVRAHLPNRK